LTSAGFATQKAFLSPFIRIAYYHDVAPWMAASFEAQLQYLSEHFVPVTSDELSGFLDRGTWVHRKPGLMLTFDDGLRSHIEIVAPLLEKYGFQGWFFVPIGLLMQDASAQPQAAEHGTVLHYQNVDCDPRVFLTLKQLSELSRKHVIGCHTAHHVRLSRSLSPQILDHEIVDAKAQLEQAIGKSVDAFSWVGGEEWAYSNGAATKIGQQFKYSFTTNTRIIRPGDSMLKLDRTHIEADFPLPLVKLQMSGLMDIYYNRKRRRVAKLLVPDYTGELTSARIQSGH